MQVNVARNPEERPDDHGEGRVSARDPVDLVTAM